MLIPKSVCYNSVRMLKTQIISSISSLFANVVNPAVKEAPAPRPPEDLPSSKPSFNLNNIVIEPAHLNVADDIQSFLHANYFKYQPTIANMTKPLDRRFLDFLAERYSTTGDRWLAYRMEPKLRNRTIVGALSGYKKYPWEAAKLEEWALRNPNPERYFAYFHAHCYRSADLYTKYKIPFIYDIELLATSLKMKGRGIEDLLLSTALLSINESKHYPLVQVLATNRYVSDTCARAGMVLEWSTKLSEIGDENGMCIFNSRHPVYDEMANADLYIRLMAPKRPDCTITLTLNEQTIQ